MKSRVVLCPDCQKRMRRKHGYKKAWYNATFAYKTVYECPACSRRMAILAMDEGAFMKDRQELLDRLKTAEARLMTLTFKVEEYRDKTNVNRFLMELDSLQKQLDRLRNRLKEM